MKLFDLVKDRLRKPNGVISDAEMCVLNRRDFIYSETSAALAFLKMFRAEHVTYEMASMIDFLHTYLSGINDKDEIVVHQLSQSMTLPSLAVSVLAGDDIDTLKIYAPRGVQKLQAVDEFSNELIRNYERKIIHELMSEQVCKESKRVDIFLCNSSSEADVYSGINSFVKAKSGLLLIKGYGRVNAPNCGEILLENRLNLHCSLAGFGICLAI